MEEHRRPQLDDRGLIVGDRALPWWGATVPYWRLPRTAWPAVLRGLAELGLTLVEVAVPWAVHERDDGRFDWSGDRDLGGFVDAAAAAGLAVVAQLGPLATLTEPEAALPARIVRDEEVWARAAHGGPAWAPLAPRAFPLPSLASTRFADALAAFHRAVAAVLAPRCAPAGPVVAIGLDPGLAGHVRGGAYDLDYHPDAIAAWRAHRDVEPPRRWDPADAATCVAWVRWGEGAAARAAARWSAVLDDAGLAGLPRVGGAAPCDPRDDHAPPPWPRMVDLASGTLPSVDVAARVQVAAAPRLVRLPAGHSPLFAPTTVEQRAELALAALAAGARGATWTMGVTTDRWLGGLVDRSGRATADGRRVAALIAAATRARLPTLRPAIDVALIVARADARFGRASSLVAPLPPIALELLALGPGGAAELSTDADAARARRWFDAVTAALALGQVAFTVVDEGADLAAVPARAFVTPTLARVDRALWRQLHALAADLSALAPRDEWIATRPAGVTVTRLVDTTDQVRALFVANRTARAVTAVLAVPADARLHDALTTAAIAVADGAARVELPAHGTRWLTAG